jgi:ADP-ribosylation factor protein 6
MKPQEVTEKLKLSQLKDKIWFVVPSCATTGEGLLEGLVCPLYRQFRYDRKPN